MQSKLHASPAEITLGLFVVPEKPWSRSPMHATLTSWNPSLATKQPWPHNRHGCDLDRSDHMRKEWYSQ